MKLLGEGQPHFGPDVYLDGQLGPQYEGTEVDVVKLGENLRRDFPEIAGEEWDNSVVCLTELAPSYGGFSADMLSVHNSSKLTRLAHRPVGNLLRFLLDYPETPRVPQLLKWGRDKDVLVVVNLAAKLKGSNKFFSEEDPPDQSTILAHELKHAVEHLLNHRVYKEDLPAVRKAIRLSALYAGSVTTGLAMMGGGGMAELFSLSSFNKTAAIASGGVVATGALFTAVPLYLAAKRGTLKHERFGLDEPEQFYGQEEDYANAYAFATRHNWQGVIKL